MRAGVLALVLAIACVGCGPARFGLVRDAHGRPPIEIRQLTLSWSNVFLLRSGDAAMLVDSGSPGDWDALGAALADEGLSPGVLRLVVLTHGHADHAGLAARLHDAGVPVALGRGDLPMAGAGRDGTLRATSVLGDLLRPFVDFSYAPFAPDLVVDEAMSLSRFGFPGVRVIPMPGHTPGSLVVWVGDRDALVGDQLVGGMGLGGGQAGEHFFEANAALNHCNVERLLELGVQRFYVGHGGPIERTSVLGWRADWAREASRCTSAQARR